MQSEIVKAFTEELELSTQPGYAPPDMEDFAESSENSETQPKPADSDESKSDDSNFSEGL